MATVLGKRKSRTTPKGQPSTSKLSREEAEAKLAQLFEAEFEPISPKANADADIAPHSPSYPKTQGSSSGSGSEDESWGGLSEDQASEEENEEEEDDDYDDDEEEAETSVEVVAHIDAYISIKTNNSTLNKRESRAWLSSRPPVLSSTETSISQKKQKSKSSTEEEDAPSLLKNDLALQRLLSESHLFSAALAKSSSSSSSDPSSTTSLNSPTEHVGRNRHLATDLRLAALGSKTSIYKQEKMPMSFRKGIQAAAQGREVKRRKEARENGIILERPGAGGSALGKKAVKQKRKGPGRDIDAPAVGRLSKGMLKLSKRDIASIESSGPRKGGGFAKKRR